MVDGRAEGGKGEHAKYKEELDFAKCIELLHERRGHTFIMEDGFPLEDRLRRREEAMAGGA